MSSIAKRLLVATVILVAVVAAWQLDLGSHLSFESLKREQFV